MTVPAKMSFYQCTITERLLSFYLSDCSQRHFYIMVKKIDILITKTKATVPYIDQTVVKIFSLFLYFKGVFRPSYTLYVNSKLAFKGSTRK